MKALTENYLARPVDHRMVNIINTRFRARGSVIDVACGSGLYGRHLQAKFDSVYAIDYDETLCQAARASGDYSEVYCDRVENIRAHTNGVDAIFCSEFIEHVSNDQLRTVLDVLEATAREEIVITVPNPRSPHFRVDPTHILEYSVRSLLETLNHSKRFTYTLHPLGFSEFNLTKPIFRALNPISKTFSALSPTVLYIGRVA
jgi:SAM-dependent methyltransferase